MQSGIKVLADRFIHYADDRYAFAISNGALLYRSKPTDKYSLLVKEFDKHENKKP